MCLFLRRTVACSPALLPFALGYGETQGAGHKIKTIGQVSNADDSTPSWFKKGVEAALLAPTAVNQQKFSFEYIGTEEQRAEAELSEDGEDTEDEESMGVFDEENPEGEELQEREQPAYRIITQTFEGTEIPAGAIPEDATDIEITTVTE